MNLDQFIFMIDLCLQQPSEELIQQHTQFLDQHTFEYLKLLMQAIYHTSDDKKLQIYYVLGSKTIRYFYRSDQTDYDTNILQQFLQTLIAKLYEQISAQNARLLLQFTSSYISTFYKKLGDIELVYNYITECMGKELNFKLIAISFIQLITQERQNWNSLFGFEQIKQFIEQLTSYPEAQKYCFRILKNIILQLQYSGPSSEQNVSEQCAYMFIYILQQHQNNYSTMLQGIQILEDLLDTSMDVFVQYLDSIMDALLHTSHLFIAKNEQEGLFFFNDDYTSILQLVEVILDPPLHIEYKDTQIEKIIQILDYIVFSRLEYFTCDEYIQQLKIMPTLDEENIYNQSLKKIKYSLDNFINKQFIMQHIQQLIQQPGHQQFVLLFLLYYLVVKNQYQPQQLLELVFSCNPESFSILDHLEFMNILKESCGLFAKQNSKNHHVQEQFINNVTLYINSFFTQAQQPQTIIQRSIELLSNVSKLPCFKIDKVSEKIYLMNETDNIITQTDKLRYIVMFYKLASPNLIEMYTNNCYQHLISFNLQQEPPEHYKIQFLNECITLVSTILQDPQYSDIYLNQQQKIQFIQRLITIFELGSQYDSKIFTNACKSILHTSISSQQIFDQVGPQLLLIMDKIQSANLNMKKNQTDIFKDSYISINQEFIELQKYISPTLTKLFATLKSNDQLIINQLIGLRDKIYAKNYDFRTSRVKATGVMADSLLFLFRNGLVDKAASDAQIFIQDLVQFLEALNIESEIGFNLTKILSSVTNTFIDYNHTYILSNLIQAIDLIINRMLSYLVDLSKNQEEYDSFQECQRTTGNQCMDMLMDLIATYFKHVDEAKFYIQNKFNSQDEYSIFFTIYFCINVYNKASVYDSQLTNNIQQLFMRSMINLKQQYPLINYLIEYFIIQDSVLHSFFIQFFLLYIPEQKELQNHINFIISIYNNIAESNTDRQFMYYYLNMYTIVHIIQGQMPHFINDMLRKNSNFDITVSLISKRYKYFDKNIVQQVLNYFLNNIGLSDEMTQVANQILDQLQ